MSTTRTIESLFFGISTREITSNWPNPSSTRTTEEFTRKTWKATTIGTPSTTRAIKERSRTNQTITIRITATRKNQKTKTKRKNEEKRKKKLKNTKNISIKFTIWLHN